jgi:exonuclease 3'-5' domain-containing protein 1
MHRAGGSGVWMERPLSTKLLQYAANDIFLISRLHDHFLNNNWISPVNMSSLLAQSERYVSMHKTHGRIEKSDQFRRGPLLPLDILSVGPLGHGACAGCGRKLSKMAYEVKTWHNGWTFISRRRARCRICHVVAIQRKLSSDDRWIAV